MTDRDREAAELWERLVTFGWQYAECMSEDANAKGLALLRDALRAARVEGARRMRDRAAAAIRLPREGCMCGEKNTLALRALDPAAVAEEETEHTEKEG